MESPPLAQMIGKTVGYQSQIGFDINQPDGAPSKLMDSSKPNALGWQASISLESGLAMVYADF